MWHRWKAVIVLGLTMVVVTIVGVLLIFRPIAESDTTSPAWHPAVAISVYVILSILLLDWAARRTRSSFAAAFVIGAAQSIFIVDLLARGERGLLTAVAGTAFVALTWLSVAFVHARLSNLRLID